MRTMTAFRSVILVAQFQSLIFISRKSLLYFADAKPIPQAHDSDPRLLWGTRHDVSLRPFVAHDFQRQRELGTRINV
jgi:hypothetical protein